MAGTQHFSKGWKAFVVTMMLISGTVTVVTTAAMFQLKSLGIMDDVHYFKKPWFETLAMFIGMFLCLFWHFLNVACARKKKDTLLPPNEPALNSTSADSDKAEQGSYGAVPPKEEKPKEMAGWKKYMAFAIPATCDLIATTLMYIGLMYTTASVFQILRGFMVVMTCILNLTFMKRKMRPYKFVGVGVVLMGLVLVGVSLVFDPTHQETTEGGSPIIGILLIIGAQLVQGTQIVIEEVLLSNLKAPPLLIVGMEGFWGILEMSIMLTVVYFVPGKDIGGHWENTLDTFVMLSNDWVLVMTLVFYFFAILFYNYFGMCVTQALSSVNRTIIESARTACIWVTDLLLYYVITAGTYYQIGEWWTDWSVLELLGFLVVFAGTMIYNDWLIIPGMNYMPFPPKK
ncbi:putative Integral membrane protein [Paratrimastix pyriformis]|uniref:Integral membrane protein n=1 Tax=Paratrimastix pyriformis TaxID=342808 RepID=A0ABQ8UU03_9EUKA|nr:putative Integral membrane protein [Paratrimastix pyriformis]